MSSINDSQSPIKKISFPLFPFDWEHNNHIIEKSDKTGNKRKYLIGVASGIQVDGHGEHLTQNAINSIQRQFNSGDILLYPDIHGIKDNEDIGILTESEILPNYDWKTSFRLYDEYDDLDDNVVKYNEKLWKKLNGIPPYTKKRQKGFSIEGYVPPEKILSCEVGKDGRVGKRVIDDVILDGVVLVPKPAYNSVAMAVYKCLGILPPEVEDKIKKSFGLKLQEIVDQKEIQNQYFKKKYDIENALDDAIREIMTDRFENERDRLNIIFEEYKNLMIDLVLNSSDIFLEEKEEDEVIKAEDKSEKIKQLLIKTKENLVLLQGKIIQGIRSN